MLTKQRQKLDRFKQWAGERMGGEAKTSTSDEFRALEMEMNLRQEGEFTVALPVRLLSRRPIR
jgi:hypothetical protein